MGAHTRLLTRAIEWNANGQDSSFVLRGTDLQTAEAWQARAAEKKPELSSLQRDYILASRKVATRRQRVTLAAVTLGLAVAVVLGAAAWLARNDAVDQANIASARLLAAQAELTNTQEGHLLLRGILLTIEAQQRLPFPSPETNKILRTGLVLHPTPLASLPHMEQVDDVVFSPNGKYLATASQDATARLWEVPSGDEAAAPMQLEAPVNDVFSPNGKYLATASDDNTSRVWEVPSGSEVTQIVILYCCEYYQFQS